MKLAFSLSLLVLVFGLSAEVYMQHKQLTEVKNTIGEMDDIRTELLRFIQTRDEQARSRENAIQDSLEERLANVERTVEDLQFMRGQRKGSK